MQAQTRDCEPKRGALAGKSPARGKGHRVNEPQIIHVVDVKDPMVFFVTNRKHAVAMRIEVRSDRAGKLSIHTTEEAIAESLHEHK